MTRPDPDLRHPRIAQAIMLVLIPYALGLVALFLIGLGAVIGAMS